MFLLILTTLAGCGDEEWTLFDLDEDGYTVADGDCDDLDASRAPGNTELWYDGVDQDCDGNDGDKDGDGYVPEAYAEASPDWRELAFGHADLQVGDCWDDPSDESFLAGYIGDAPPAAAEVNAGAEDTWYDGVDSDCDGRDDFDQDGDGYAVADVGGEDCDDTDPAVSPETEEIWYDGVDQDCDGNDDDQDGDGFGYREECDDTDPSAVPNPSITDTWYDCLDANCDGNDGDQDGDGFVPQDYAEVCEWTKHKAHLGAGDCWDDPEEAREPLHDHPALSAAEVNPDASEDQPYDGVDADCDGLSDFDADLDGYDTTELAQRDGQLGEDCDDADPTVNPGVEEDCATAETDDDCDGELNDLSAVGCTTWYADNDEDGYGSLSSVCACEPRDAFKVTNDDDCDDTEPTTYPGATETTGDGVDSDCDDQEICYVDADDDGYVADSTATVTSDDEDCADSGEATLGEPDGDCDDTEPAANPGEGEVCDGLDNDCDGITDPDDALDAHAPYPDSDGDGYGDPSGEPSSDAPTCTAPSGYVINDDDCDDADAFTYPGAAATESSEACMTDGDGDGYGADDPATGVTAGSDCDDADSGTNPGISEGCFDDLVDSDCDELVDEGPSGACFTAGDLVISELLMSSALGDPDYEWFEVINNAGADMDLLGLRVELNDTSSGQSAFFVGTSLVLADGDRAVFCHGDGALGSSCDYVYGSDQGYSLSVGNTYAVLMTLCDSADCALSLSAGGYGDSAGSEISLDEVDYDTASPWPGFANSYAIELSEAALSGSTPDADNDDGASWCLTDGSSSYYSGEYGTPGSANTCP